MRAKQATVIDIALFLGITPRRVQQVITQHGIEPTGTRWKANLYDPRQVFAACGAHHRGAS